MEYLLSGWQALTEYLSAHVLTCLIPAFFIAGAIAVFVSQAAVMKYFGAQAKKTLAYGVASVSGTILAVCSCTVLPLFAGIRQRGAGLGPAVAFLYSGPAINVLAVVYSARLLGLDIGAARALGAIGFSIVIGLIMAFLFRHEEEKFHNSSGEFALPSETARHPLWQMAVYFALMVALLVAASSIKLAISLSHTADGRGVLSLTGTTLPAASALLLLIGVIYLARRWYASSEIADWLRETWILAKKIFPILLVGVFIAGILKALLPQPLVQNWVGGNSLWANLIASIFGAFMYFSTLTEVPIVKSLMDLGMGRGPALALLLSGPSLSLPSMIVIGRIMGIKRTAAYAALVIILSSVVGMAFGLLHGR